jgi:hypothetical protein
MRVKYNYYDDTLRRKNEIEGTITQASSYVSLLPVQNVIGMPLIVLPILLILKFDGHEV